MEEEVTPGREAPEDKSSWLSRHTSVATRLAVAVLGVSLIPLLVSAIVASNSAGASTDELLESRLVALAESTERELEGFTADYDTAVSVLAESQATVEAVQDFAVARQELANEPIESLDEERTRLAEFYIDEWLPKLEAVRGETVDPAEFDSADSASVYLQTIYVADNSFEIGEKSLLTDPADGSSWTEVHRAIHPHFRAVVNEYGLSDLYLVDAEDLNVVYSVGKDAAFAANLAGGDLSGSALGRVVRETLDSGTTEVVRADFTAFEPALDEPVAFVAKPLVADGNTVGVVVAGVTSSGVSEVMSRAWRDGRAGDTGEIYVVGPDRRMRSDSRFFVEDPEGYVVEAESEGDTELIDLNRMAALETTVLFQEVDNPAIRSGLAGEAGLVDGTNYLGREVKTAYGQIEGGFGWVVVAEQERQELGQPSSDLTRDALVVTAIFIVVVTFVAVGWANLFVSPLRSVSAALVRVSDGSSFTTIPRRGAREFRQLAASIDDMVVVLAQRTGAATRAVAHKVETLRVLLPPAAIARINDGSRRLVETSRQATVVALSFPGIDAIVSEESRERRREIINAIVDEADALAELNGLQRVKVGSDRYFAVCGTETPYLDHAQRGISFASQLRAELIRYAADEDLDIGMQAGIDSGSVTVGLIGESRLVYDLWGEAVDNASLLSRAAPDGDILITEATNERSSTAVTPFEVPNLDDDAYRLETPTVHGVTT